MTELLFRDDAYRRETEAHVVGVDERGGILLDRTIFFATGGGQPGDSGRLVAADGEVPIATTVYGATKSEIVHLPGDDAKAPSSGTAVKAEIDWERRHLHMRMHTALHLLCSIVPFPVTGGSIGTGDGRLDFDMPDNPDKAELTERLLALIEADHPVASRWISEEELRSRPELVRTMSVMPPMDGGRVRLVSIGEDGQVDLQPCGGTHVLLTGEIGGIEVVKIEKKGRQNRRVRVKLADTP